jgi:hypothetical protein
MQDDVAGPGAASALGATSVDRAIVVAGGLLALCGAAFCAAAADDRPWPDARSVGLALPLGGALLGAGLIVGQRPAALWAAALAAAALWPLWPLRSARPGVRRWAAIAVPALLAVVCAIDALMP